MGPRLALGSRERPGGLTPLNPRQGKWVGRYLRGQLATCVLSKRTRVHLKIVLKRRYPMRILQALRSVRASDDAALPDRTFGGLPCR